MPVTAVIEKNHKIATIRVTRDNKLEEGASDQHFSKKPCLLWGELVQAVRQGYGEAGISALGSQETFAKVLNSKRNMMLPPIPRRTEDLAQTKFPERFRTTLTGEQYLILNTSKEENCQDLILRFSSQTQLQMLLGITVWYRDGTF